MRRVVIPGGSGRLGTLLARYFHHRGDDVTVLSRKPFAAPWRVAAYDPKEIDGADVVINLAGRNVDCRYSDENRRAIMSSRVESTRWLAQAIAVAKKPPRLWLQSSTATIYAHRYDAANDEPTGIIGGDERDAPDVWRFSIDVARAWERVTDELPAPLTRKVKLRTAVVMTTATGGPFERLSRLVRRGLGGAVGDGRQFVSWIHPHDFIRAIEWLIEHEELDGPVNIAAPQPLSNRDFMRGLRDAWGIRFGLPVPFKWMMEIGAFFFRTESELILKSRRVVPLRLEESGFHFLHPEWFAAARDLVASVRAPVYAEEDSLPRA